MEASKTSWEQGVEIFERENYDKTMDFNSFMSGFVDGYLLALTDTNRKMDRFYNESKPQKQK